MVNDVTLITPPEPYDDAEQWDHLTNSLFDSKGSPLPAMNALGLQPVTASTAVKKINP
jgi:hypothetical protein